MIPEANRGDVIQSGINFIRAITEAYGTDEGMKLWETISDTLDPEVKGQIFLAMLKGEYQGRVRISRGDFSVNSINHSDKITKIKALRLVSGFGLKEAKDGVEALEWHNTPIEFEIDASKRGWAVEELRRVGLFQ